MRNVSRSFQISNQVNGSFVWRGSPKDGAAAMTGHRSGTRHRRETQPCRVTPSPTHWPPHQLAMTTTVPCTTTPTPQPLHSPAPRSKNSHTIRRHPLPLPRLGVPPPLPLPAPLPPPRAPSRPPRPPRPALRPRPDPPCAGA